MISFWRIFWLEFTSLTRSRTVAMLTVAALGWMFAAPHVLTGDGTAAGARELQLHFSLGGVFVLLVVALLASATASVAGERAAKRLQLTLVRPVRYFTVALGKIAAHVAVGAFVLGLSCLALISTADCGVRCSHVLSPVLPSPREEALAMYESYMNDPDTPAQVRRAKKEVVLRILTQRALDHYQTIPTNATVSWKFDLPQPATQNPQPATLSVRMRFTNPMEMRQDVFGTFRYGNLSATVSNITQAVLTVPLTPCAAGAPEKTGSLRFSNKGVSALMVRPRRDVNLLVPADAFGWNLLRAFFAMVSVLALIVASGVFLSSALGRPVATFVAFVVLIVGEMSPSVVEQYPDELSANLADRIGLCITRVASVVTRPISDLAPLEALSKDECVERTAVLRIVLLDLLGLPLALALLAAFVIPRKQEDGPQ